MPPPSADQPPPPSAASLSPPAGLPDAAPPAPPPPRPEPDPDGPPPPPGFDRRIPDGDTRERLVCGQCGYIRYDNPKIVVGAVCTWEDRVLMARRAIDPRRGYWTIPAGYMELNETTQDGAAREVLEEACARVRIGALLAVFNLPHISQVHLIYRATMLSPHHAPGVESLETALVTWEGIPWDALAYPTVGWALHQHAAMSGRRDFAPRGTPPPDPDGPAGVPSPLFPDPNRLVYPRPAPPSAE